MTLKQLISNLELKTKDSYAEITDYVNEDTMEVIVHCEVFRSKKRFGVSTANNDATDMSEVAELGSVTESAAAQVDMDPDDCEVGETFTVEI